MTEFVIEKGSTLELHLTEDPNKSETYVALETFDVEKAANEVGLSVHGMTYEPNEAHAKLTQLGNHLLQKGLVGPVKKH